MHEIAPEQYDYKSAVDAPEDDIHSGSPVEDLGVEPARATHCRIEAVLNPQPIASQQFRRREAA